MSIFYQDRQEQFHLFLSANNTFSLHLHRQAEGILVLSGSIQVTVDGQSRLFKKGEYFFIFPHQIHSLYTESHSRILLFLFDPSFCPAFEASFRHYFPLFHPLSTDLLSLHGRQALKALQELWLGPGSRSDGQKAGMPDGMCGHRHMLLTESYLQILLADTFPALRLTPHGSQRHLEPVQGVLLYIEAHYTEDITLDTLAAEFHMSRFTISRLFSEKLHTSFPSYLNGWRLEHARRLLLSSSLSVTEAAYESGFTSARTFFRAFREEYGMPPGQYVRSGLKPPTAATEDHPPV